MPHLATDVHAPKENEDVPRQISLHLHRTEEAGGVMHLLAGSDKDVLPHIRAVPRGLAERPGGEQKRQNQATQNISPQDVPPEKTRTEELIRGFSKQVRFNLFASP
jgi:hypothetical protein